MATEQETEFDLFDLPGQLLDQVMQLLDRVGVEASPFATQFLLLALIVATLIVFRKKFWPLRRAEPLVALAGVALALVALGITVSWGNALLRPFPDHIVGQVRAADLNGIRITLRDRRDDSVAVGSGVVDSVSGEFVLRYRLPFNDRPTGLVVSKTGCRDQRHVISRTRLRSGGEFVIDFTCEATE